jgi:hypothetical protein
MLNGPELKETSPTGRLTAVLPMLICGFQSCTCLVP